MPTVVAEAVRDTMVSATCQRGTITPTERRTDAIVLGARQAIADLLGVDAGGVVFGRSMTQLTFDFARTIAQSWGPGDEVVVSRLDHDANIRPWEYAAKRAGATLRYAEFDPATGEITADDVEEQLSDRTRLVAITAASNLIGTRPSIREIAERVHARGALLYVDGVHNTPHTFVDVSEMGADFYVCSPYKFCGPHIGVLVASPALLETLAPEKLLPSANTVPERFELGTPSWELLAGTTAAVDFLASFGEAAPTRREQLQSAMTVLEAHEDALRRKLEVGLAEHPRVTVYSRAQVRTPTLLFTVDGMEPIELTARLAEYNINAPASSFYALEASRALGLGDAGGVRLGLAPYSCAEDVDRVLEALKSII
jgi:cysteine desulfurase family protein (TIGR01976 family)